jgi:hypothetical protein
MKMPSIFLAFLMAIVTSVSAQANSTQNISRGASGQIISGLSMSGDVTDGGRCASSQSVGEACLEFNTPDLKVVTLKSEFDRTWSIWNQQKGVSEPLQIGQSFLSNTDGRKNASAKVQSFNSRSLTLSITPLKATDSNLVIDIGDTFIVIVIIVNKTATPSISLNCPQSVTTLEKKPLVVKIQSNIPVTWQDYMDYGWTSWGWDRERNSIEVSVGADSTFLQLKITPKIVSSYGETIRIKASSILDNPYPVELPDVSCELFIKSSSSGRVPSYKAFWKDGSQSAVRKFTADNSGGAYVIVQFVEKDAKGKPFALSDFSQKDRRVKMEVRDSSGIWNQQFDRALNSDFEVGFDFANEIFNCRNKCRNGTERIRLISEDGILIKEFQITLAKGFFDFSIQAPSQVEWGKKYRVSIKANKSLNGTCSFYSYYRGNIPQGTSRMINGSASKLVEFYWGDIKSTTVQVEVVCKSTGFTVSNIAYIRGFRR